MIDSRAGSMYVYHHDGGRQMPKPEYATIADLIRGRSKALGFKTLKKLHEACGRRGLDISYNALHLWHVGKRVPDAHHLEALLDVLGVHDPERRERAYRVAYAPDGATPVPRPVPGSAA